MTMLKATSKIEAEFECYQVWRRAAHQKSFKAPAQIETTAWLTAIGVLPSLSSASKLALRAACRLKPLSKAFKKDRAPF